jgi:hypothetical protein
MSQLERITYIDRRVRESGGARGKEAVMRFYGRAYVEFSVPVSQWNEILGRFLRFGSNGEAVAPPEFRELWKEEIRRMAAGIE